MNNATSNGAQQAPNASAPSTVVMECIGQLQQMQQQYPEWFEEYEDAMVDVVADRATIEALLESAPNEFLRGMIYGKLAMRVQISILTERGFS